MEIQTLLKTDAMILDLKATDKPTAIAEMVQKLVETGYVSDGQKFQADILAREAQGSTGFENGVAIPHAKNAVVKTPVVLFAKSKQGLDYQAMDGQLTHLFFMIAAPEGANDTHLAALSKLSVKLMDADFVAQLKTVTTPQAVLDLFGTNDTTENPVAQTTTDTNKPYIVAVTACTTGIAHTYMAEKALKEQAEKMGVAIKVETNGASGIDHALTAKDIEDAIGVIVAADRNIEMARFNQKHLVKRPVADGIKKPEELINLALSEQAPIYHDSSNVVQTNDKKQTIAQKIYTHLMSGVSAMLPFVIGGGIAIALAFLIDQSLGVPKDQLASLGTYHLAAAFFKQIGGAAFSFMLPVLAGYIAYSMAEKPGLVAGFTAGYLANSGFNIFNVGLNPDKLPISSGFLGALVGGFLAGGVMILLKQGLKKLPKSLDGIRSILFYPVFGVILTGFLMLLVNIPMSSINTGLNQFLENLSGANAVILGALLGGMMAIDMGGPINKAAYVFGTGTLAASITTGGSEVMASVMAGGMVPPLAIFVATLVFKHKFTQTDRQAGLTNIIMGLSFITEGAIPFAAADPARVLPSFVVGSAVTGGLVSAAGIKLLAPHGGIFVIALTNKPLLYLLFIFIGAIIAGVIYGLIRPKEV